MNAIPLTSVWTIAIVGAAAITFVALSCSRLGRRLHRTGVRVAVVALASAALGISLTWWCTDVLDLFGFAPSLPTRIWVAATFAVVGAIVTVVVVVRGRSRIALGAVAVVLVIVTGALGVNRDGGLFPTVGSLLGAQLPPLAIPSGQPGASTDAPNGSAAERTASDRGAVGMVTIPGTRSGFHARKAVVYLPPAALGPRPPRLPVLVVLSGQGPGAAPMNVVDAGHLPAILDAYAARHQGITPITVVPDQLGNPLRNPMCVDGPLGNSRTYLTRDVPDWIEQHLRVRSEPSQWAIAGFSQGATCAVQLGASAPERFGSLIAVSAQLGPTLGDRRDTIARGFGGDERAWAAAQPIAIFAAHAPYPGSAAYLTVGQDDDRYGPVVHRVATAARAAGLDVTTSSVPGAHDWRTASTGLDDGIGWWIDRLERADAAAAGALHR